MKNILCCFLSLFYFWVNVILILSIISNSHFGILNFKRYHFTFNFHFVSISNLNANIILKKLFFPLYPSQITLFSTTKRRRGKEIKTKVFAILVEYREILRRAKEKPALWMYVGLDDVPDVQRGAADGDDHEIRPLAGALDKDDPHVSNLHVVQDPCHFPQLQ